jgi:ribosome-associated translation inhibitor RaiA
MIRVVFKNMSHSEAMKESVLHRLKTFEEKFPDLFQSKITTTVELRNSPEHAGQDLYTVTLHIHGGRYHGVRLQKSSVRLVAALGDVADHLLERLNRFGDRTRVKERKLARKFVDTLRQPLLEVS